LYGDKNSSAWNKITNKSWILYGAKNKVREVKLHMSLDASQMLYGIHDYPPSGLHYKPTTYGLHCVGEEFRQ